MRAVVQRVSSASVTVGGRTTGEIGRGLLVFVGIAPQDGDSEARWIADKVANLRIFEDDEGKMNRSLLEIEGEVQLVSQFTLYGDARKGRRPSFVRAAQGAEAERIYEAAVAALRGLIQYLAAGLACRAEQYEAGLVSPKCGLMRDFFGRRQ